MSTEVGSLSASLTLDMSDFQAGMTQARELAAELASALQQAFNPGAGITQMIRDVTELAQQMSILRAELLELKALQESMSGADMFAAMKAHTASLPGDIANIRSELSSLSTTIYSLNDDVELVVSNLRDGLSSAAGSFQATLDNIGASLSSIAGSASALVAELQPLASTGTLLDFSVPLEQMQYMAAAAEAMRAAIAGMTSVDMNTGETSDTFGSEFDSSLSNVRATVEALSERFARIAEGIYECVQATLEWSNALTHVDTQMSLIYSDMGVIQSNTSKVASGMTKAGKGARNFTDQTSKAAKNLRTVKGYALSVQGIIGGIVVAQTFYRLLDIMQRLVNGAKEFSTNMQDAAVSFNYLIRGEANVRTGSILNALTNIAQTSPMSSAKLMEASRQLMAMGFSAKATVPTLNILVDTAAAVGGGADEMSDKIQHITLAFGQMIAAGKVSAQELRQLYNAGLPIYELLSKGLGITMKEAKNIGKLNVDSATAVYAILQQLQERYAGAAKDLSRTVAGAQEVIKESLQITLARAWQPYFEHVNGILNKLEDKVVAFSKITQAYGIGGLFQAIFPRNLWAPLRQLLAGLIQLGKAFAEVGVIIRDSFGTALTWVIKVMGPVVYVIGTLARLLAALARAAYTAYPAVRILFAAVALLVIAGVVAKLVLLLAKAIWWLSGAAAAAKAIAALVRTIAGLAVAHPITFVLLAIAAAFLAIVAASEKARAAIARFFGKAAGGLQDFMQDLGIGLSPGDVAMPEFELPDMDDFSSGIEDLVDSMDDLADAEDDANGKAKKLKDNLQSFDEVYRIGDDDSGGGLGDGFDDLLDRLGGLGNLNYSDLFNWTGDWETDWGNLTAGLEGFVDDLGEGIGDLVSWLQDLINTITGGDGPRALLDLADALTIFFAAIGKFKLAGMLQFVEGFTKIVHAISDAIDHGWNFNNLMELIDGLSNVIVGLGLLSHNWKLTGFGLLLSGLHDVVKGINEIATMGLNVDSAMKVVEGLGKIIAGLGLLKGNFKLAGVGLMISGMSKIVKELEALAKGFKTGDWSGVNWVSLFTGVVEFIAGLLMVCGVLGKLKKASKALEATGAAEAAASAGNSVKNVSETVKTQVSPKLKSLAMNLLLGLAIIAEVCAAVLLIVGTILLLGEMLKKMADAWDIPKEEALRCITALGIGVAALVAVGLIMAALGNAGTALIVQMALGAAILGEVCVATDLLILNVVLLGSILHLVIDTWTPVLEQLPLVEQAITTGAALLLAVGVACGLLGTLGASLVAPMAIGAAILLEASVACDLFIVEIAAIGVLLQKVTEAWAPVQAHGAETEQAILQGTTYLLAVGAACAALGVATVASAGLLPVAIGLGTLMIIECTAAVGALFDSIVTIATRIVDDLLPALTNVNEVIPQATELMNAFVAFMADFAIASSSYTSSMGDLTWDSIVQGFYSLFASDPLSDLAEEIQDIAFDVLALNNTLVWAVSELEKCVDMLTSYNSFMSQLELLLANNGTVELQSGMFTNLKAVGEKLVAGLIVGINTKKPQAKETVRQMGQDIVEQLRAAAIAGALVVRPASRNLGQQMIDGILEGIDARHPVLMARLEQNQQQIKTSLESFFNPGNWVHLGANVCRGISQGISANAGAVIAQAQSLAEQIRNIIQSALDMHSPSRVMITLGGYIDEGLAIGMRRKQNEVRQSAKDVANLLKDSVENADTPELTLSSSLTDNLGGLRDWGSTFVEILQEMFRQINAMFDGLTGRLSGLNGGITAKIGSIRAAEQLATSGAHPTGTKATPVVLDEATMKQLTSMAADRMYEYLAPLFANLNSDDRERAIMYVGTLVADDAGLRELERKLNVVRLNEGRRS